MPQKDLTPFEPCNPSPCGPYSKCRSLGDAPACSCLENYIGQPPNCRPECITSSDCSRNLACVQQKCINPCEGKCGSNALCQVVSHVIQCLCNEGFTGDPFESCTVITKETVEVVYTPCSPSPCGYNAICRELHGAGSCQCIPNYFGNPYEGCRPECVTNSDCPSNKICQLNKCIDPCPGTCGFNAQCNVIEHQPICNCIIDFTGNPYQHCSKIEGRKLFFDFKSFTIYLCL